MQPDSRDGPLPRILIKQLLYPKQFSNGLILHTCPQLRLGSGAQARSFHLVLC